MREADSIFYGTATRTYEKKASCRAPESRSTCLIKARPCYLHHLRQYSMTVRQCPSLIEDEMVHRSPFVPTPEPCPS